MTAKNKPIVLNKYKPIAELQGVYIGRGSPYGNPFIIGKDGDRDDVCNKFEQYITAPEQAWLVEKIKEELKGKNVVCFCAPARCHGNTIIKIANQ
jgi:hypothetical protein